MSQNSTQAQHGASLGGPVVRDRTFYFTNFEQRLLKLEDGGRDAPMSRRGRILFSSIVGVLVVGIVVLLLVTASSR